MPEGPFLAAAIWRLFSFLGAQHFLSMEMRAKAR